MPFCITGPFWSHTAHFVENVNPVQDGTSFGFLTSDTLRRCWPIPRTTDQFAINPLQNHKNMSRKIHTKLAPCSSLTMSLLCWVLDMMPLTPRGSTPHCTGRMSGDSLRALVYTRDPEWRGKTSVVQSDAGVPSAVGLSKERKVHSSWWLGRAVISDVFMVQNDD